ncbi:hypothetical protein J5N97_007561 [Dioscorea zingiberensis]|uniref:Plant heme peroxidase family profile domain-containing protein n=1 Tax=Dioscorea zingiberensis TaxID=325984 RepID=A0A9D5HTQ3_9LILI|nr:hypothetical protein J5N97_007561 [Dioscorea zingiberensis]
MVTSRSPLLVPYCVAVALTVIAVVTEVHGGNAGLSYDFYHQTCPQVESIVSQALLPIFASDPRSPAGFLRLFFHDCLVQGCDASILLDHNDGEMASSKNFGIRNRELIQMMNSLIELQCPGVVSCADIIALAAKEAVAFSGGPYFDIPLGRKDATSSSFLQAEKELPSPSEGVGGTLGLFSSKGMSIEEFVALLVHRLYDKDKRHEVNMDYGYEMMLRLKCHTGLVLPLNNETFVANDLTALIFDNQYYKDIVSGRGLFTVDSELAVDPRTAPFVKMFAEDQEEFFRAFSMAFVKLSSLVLSREGGGVAALSNNYYQETCPQVESIISKALLPIFVADPRIPAVFLRLLLHDCLVQGCDASILLEIDDGEMASDRNFGVRSLELIGAVKKEVEESCPGVVSCADVIALAAREAVVRSGGPRIVIPLGRKDAVHASNLMADEKLPAHDDGVDAALRIFSPINMNTEETVAILGAHTLGVGHCTSIVHRLYGSRDLGRENLSPLFEEFLRLNCPTRVPLTNITFIFNDLTTLLFDNQYFRDIDGGRGLFTIDSELSVDPRTAAFVRRFAEDNRHFFSVFSKAFVKLSTMGVLTGDGDGGEVRRVCSRVNV